jgi:hypothetical protein
MFKLAVQNPYINRIPLQTKPRNIYGDDEVYHTPTARPATRPTRRVTKCVTLRTVFVCLALLCLAYCGVSYYSLFLKNFPVGASRAHAHAMPMPKPMPKLKYQQPNLRRAERKPQLRAVNIYHEDTDRAWFR